MIPILYESMTQVGSNGLGRLSDCISCKVTEERNGIYELDMEYPRTGIHHDDIQEGRIIYTTHDASRIPQPFVVYKLATAIGGITTVYAHHLSYLMNSTVVIPSSYPASFTGRPDAIYTSLIQNSVVSQTPATADNFEFVTDITASKTLVMDKPEALRKLIMGTQETSILSLFGGELEYRDHTVYLWSRRGQDRGITARYGRDLIDYSGDASAEETYTGVVPFWIGESSVVYLPERYLLADFAPAGDLRFIPLDLSSEFQSAPTQAQLRAAAQAYLAKVEYPWLSLSNSKVVFEPISQNLEFGDVENLSTVLLCDTIGVDPMGNGVYFYEKVIRTEYDPLTERYTSIELGVPQDTLSDVITKRVEGDLSGC